MDTVAWSSSAGWYWAVKSMLIVHHYMAQPSHLSEACTSQVEVLVEMAARSQDRQGNLNLYTPLTAVEAVK